MYTSGWACKIHRTGKSGSYKYLVDSNGDGIEGRDWVNRPVNYVSWGDAVWFANWLHNGQPTGVQDQWPPEKGAYDLNSASSNSSLMKADYEDDSYGDTQRDLAGPTDEGGWYYEVDVTDFVLADYESDGEDPESAFRLQVNEVDFVDNDEEGRYRFIMPGAEANHPELILTFIPEPSTLVLLTIGLLALSYQRRKCR